MYKMSDMNRREFNKSLLKGLGATALAAKGSLAITDNVQGKTPDKPNIVFICSDQHAYKYTGYMGHPFVKTPNMDRIARNGTVFESCYSGNPVCVPARASMMTGMYASDCNSYCNSTVWDGSHPLWSKRLKDAGYYCWATGKLDLDDKLDTGFVEVETQHGHISKPDITSLFRRPVGYRINEREEVTGKSSINRNSDVKKAATVLNFINEQSAELKQPWAMYVGFHEPHPKFVGYEKYYNMYYPNQVDMPNIPPGHLEDLHLVYQELRHFKRIATPIPEDRIRRARAAYYAMISELDEYIGKLLDALELSGQLKNTIFIYTSDHGESLGEHGLWYKNNLYDVAARVPLIMMGPGIPKGRRISIPVGHVDVVATMLEWAKIKRPPELRGYSLVPLLKGKSGNHPGFAFSETHSEGNCTGSFMIRKGDWKYIHFTWYDDLLFNVKEDPNEFNNRINDPETKDIVTELKTILESLVNTEAVTIKAFKAQEGILKKWANQMTEDELFEQFKSRLGSGQARSMAKMVIDRFVE
jgi:choline-sulfatase